MKIFLMTDLEGVAGVKNAVDWIYPTSPFYAVACRLLTGEVNAAVSGFFDAGASEVLVADGHGAGAIPSALAVDWYLSWPVSPPVAPASSRRGLAGAVSDSRCRRSVGSDQALAEKLERR